MRPLSDPGRYVPLASDHPGIGTICSICQEPLLAGQVPALVGDPEPSKYARNVEAFMVHEDCAYPEGATHAEH